jgi:hypothetical protein
LKGKIMDVLSKKAGGCVVILNQKETRLFMKEMERRSKTPDPTGDLAYQILCEYKDSLDGPMIPAHFGPAKAA